VSEECLTRGDSVHSDTVWSRSIPSYDIPEHGPFTTSEPDWKPGHRIQRGAGDAIEVMGVVAAEDGDDVSGYLVVAPAMKV
jgi:hypothetical protein